MVKHVLFLLLLSVFTQVSWSATFEASVDRSSISEGESLFLTLRYNSNITRGNPDLSPLNQQFDVINSSRKNSFQYINGQSESWTIWTITITPKRKGNLVIPSIEFEGEKTKPIQINVAKVDPNIAKQDKDVFFHTETDVKTSYVQGQVVYTEKLYFSVPLDNSQLNEVQVEDAVLEPLGETRQYRTQLNGRNFEVYERRYVIFPQTSGELIIPGPRYSGEVSNGRWRPGRPISVSHPPVRLQVLPQPAQYPNGTWLPAKNVQINAQWLGNQTKMKIGEPITLSLSLEAEGLTSAQLPAIELPEVNGLKYYPEQAQKNDRSSDMGITGSISQNIAIVATESGTIRLPEIRIPWFNITNGRTEYATLPRQTMTVTGQTTANITPKITAESEPEQITESTNAAPSTSSISLNTSNHPFWPVVSFIFMLLWLITGYLLWRQYKKPNDEDKQEKEKQQLLNGHLKAVKNACRNNNASEARAAILSWAQTQLDTNIMTLQQLGQRYGSKELIQALQELDYTLYSSSGNSAWQGEFLWQLIRNLKAPKNQQETALQPLYP